MYSTKLTSAQGYNVDNILFSKPEVGSIPNSVPKISFKRIRIGTKYDDGTTGDLIVETPPNLFSFGMQENREMGTNNVNGYVLPICLWNKNGPSAAEKQFTDLVDQIINKCKDHLINSKDEIERYDLDMADLKNLNPLYWKKEKGKIVEGTGPVVYIKLMMSKKNEKINTFFINENTNEEMNPHDILNRRCFVKGAFKFESIFIGNKISIQLKLYEALIKPVEIERRTLLSSNVLPARKEVDTDTTSSDIFEAMEVSATNEAAAVPVPKPPIQKPPPSKDEEEGSIDGSSSSEEDEDDDEETTTTPPPPPPPASQKKPPAAPRKSRTTTKKE